MYIKQKFKKCKLQITKHAFRRFVEKNFPIAKLRKMIFQGRWFSHIEPEKLTCICKESSEYWTIIIAPTNIHIFISIYLLLLFTHLVLQKEINSTKAKK